MSLAARAKAAASPAPMARPGHPSRAKPLPESEPAAQWRKRSKTSGGAFSTMIPVSEASITDKPAPASTRRTGLVPVSRAWPRRNTAMPARPAPRKAQPRYWPMLARSNSATPTITASAAPALIPSRPGSASELRVSACISAPATPSAAPASSATRVRGRRSSRTTRWRSSCGSTACRASRVTARGTGREPSARLARAASASSSAPASRPQARRRRRRIGDACMSGLPANGRMAQRKWRATLSIICRPE